MMLPFPSNSAEEICHLIQDCHNIGIHVIDLDRRKYPWLTYLANM